ncbi:hypothetical protein C6H65_03220 [Photorhabdus luminescens]|nr:hypothetical protein C6H65_03220 [Photorhabdus luminescens]
MKSIKEIAKNYLNSEEVDTVLSSVSEKFGFDLSDDINIDSHILRNYARKITSKTKIDDGISLLITNKNHHIENISVKKTSSGLQALIDISIKG